MIKLNIVITMSYLSTGGAERVAVNYANWLVKNTNSKVTFIIFNDEKTLYSLDKDVNTIILEKELKNSNSNKIVKVLNRIKIYKKELEKLNPDIIFTMFPKTALYTLICKPKNTKLVSSERCNINKLSFVNKVISIFVSFMCNGYIFQTKRMMDIYPKMVRKKSIVIPNSVSININNETFEKEKLVVGMGRLTEQKGFDVLIKAFALFNKEYPNYELYIIGDGKDKNMLIELIEELNLNDKVKLLGNLKNPEQQLLKAEIFVLSSRYEGMPNALMEAMACGLPCISTDCEAGPSELIDNYKNGILVNVDNFNEMSYAMKNLASNGELRELLSKNAKKILVTNSPTRIFDTYYKYMKKIVYSKK